MAEHHDIFTAPENRDSQLWRYMDFSKYVSLLHHNALHFARADLLGDPYEGSVSKENIRQRLIQFKDISEEARLKGRPDPVTQISGILSHVRKWTYVSCWHLNDIESAAMWKLYSYSSEAIAVQTTFQRLYDALPSGYYLGLVKYIDYNSEWMPEGNVMYPILHKRKSFAHEREVRAVRQIFPPSTPKNGDEPETNLNQPNSQESLTTPIDLKALLESVRIAPTAPKWFCNLVKSITTKYGFSFPVNESSLDNSPVY
jgi:hypothetical protein